MKYQDAGHPRKITPRDDSNMAADCCAFMQENRAFLQLAGADINISTVSQCLSKEFGLKLYKPEKKKTNLD